MFSAAQRIPAVVWDVVNKDAQCAIMYLCSAASATHVTPTLIPLDTLLSDNTRISTKPPQQQQQQQLEEEQQKESTVDMNKEWKLVYDVMRVQHHSILFENSHVERIVNSYTETAHQLLSNKAIERLRSSLRTYANDDSVRLPDHDEQNLKFITWVVPITSSSSTVAYTYNNPITKNNGNNNIGNNLETEELQNSLDHAQRTSSSHSELSTDMNEDVFFVMYFIRSFFPPLVWYETGTELALLYHASRVNPHAKVIQTSLRARAKALQDSAHVFEVLLVHDEEDEYLIPEGSRSNYLLLTHDNKFLCSSKDDILIGITLSSALGAINDAHLGIVEHRKLNFTDLCSARSFIMLGTSVGTLPVRSLVLYTDDESKRDFMEMTERLAIDLTKVHGYKVIASTDNNSKEVSEAILEFDVSNETLRELKRAYDAAAYKKV